MVGKIKTWLFEHIDDLDSDEEEEYEHIDECDPAIISIVLAIEKMFDKSMDIKNQNFDNQIQDNLGQNITNPTQVLQATNPMQVLLKIFRNEKRSTANILKHLAIPLIKFIKFHLNNKNV